MTTSETYKLLQCVIAFRESYKKLQQVYDSMDEADLREQYPLGQIDLFDDNTKNAIVAWLNHHSVTLMNSLPDRVLNPACIACLLKSKSRCSLTVTGACNIKSNCFNYPYITFDSNMIRQFLNTQEYDTDIRAPLNAEDSAVRTLYHNLLNKLEIQEDVR